MKIGGNEKGLHQRGLAGGERVTLVRAQGSSLVRRRAEEADQQTCICSWMGPGYYVHEGLLNILVYGSSYFHSV